MISLDEVLLKKDQVENDILDFIVKRTDEFSAKCGIDINLISVQFEQSRSVGRRDQYSCVGVRISLDM